MNPFSLTTPIAFFIFNRPDTTRQVFEAIRSAKPRQLLLVADGPRQDRPDDLESCAIARAIVEQVDWDCEVLKNFSDSNLGCKNRMTSGIDWVFNTVEEAIILEHDTLPHPTFFPFCQELLDRYRGQEQIMMISGCNFQFGRSFPYSYYFSRYVHCWGWASWRRAWRKYDADIKIWPQIRHSELLQNLFGEDTYGAKYWQRVFDLTYLGYVDTWDYQWVLACWQHQAVSILPEVNLVSNIGFGCGATHTNQITSKAANIPLVPIKFPLHHPSAIICDKTADALTQKLYNTGEM